MCENLLSTNSDALFCGEFWYAEGLSLSAQQICNPVRILQPAAWTKLSSDPFSMQTEIQPNGLHVAAERAVPPAIII